MMQKYVLSKRAEKDLANIWRYTVDAWSREQADKYVRGILEACTDISNAPAFLGRTYDHVRSGYRKYPFGKHIIFYQIQTSGMVLVSRILHERMDFDRHL